MIRRRVGCNSAKREIVKRYSSQQLKTFGRMVQNRALSATYEQKKQQEKPGLCFRHRKPMRT